MGVQLLFLAAWFSLSISTTPAFSAGLKDAAAAVSPLDEQIKEEPAQHRTAPRFAAWPQRFGRPSAKLLIGSVFVFAIALLLLKVVIALIQARRGPVVGFPVEALRPDRPPKTKGTPSAGGDVPSDSAEDPDPSREEEPPVAPEAAVPPPAIAQDVPAAPGGPPPPEEAPAPSESPPPPLPPQEEAFPPPEEPGPPAAEEPGPTEEEAPPLLPVEEADKALHAKAASLAFWHGDAQAAAEAVKRDPNAVLDAEHLFSKGVELVREAERTPLGADLDPAVVGDFKKKLHACTLAIVNFQWYMAHRWQDLSIQHEAVLKRSVKTLREKMQQAAAAQLFPGFNLLRLMRQIKANVEEERTFQQRLMALLSYPSAFNTILLKLSLAEEAANAAEKELRAAASHWARLWRSKLRHPPLQEGDAGTSGPRSEEPTAPEALRPEAAPVGFLQEVKECLAELVSIVGPTPELAALEQQLSGEEGSAGPR